MVVFGYILIFIGITGLFSGQGSGLMLGPILILDGLIMILVFDNILLFCGRQFSKKRRIVLGIITFFIPILFVQQSTINVAEILTSLFVTLIFWIFMFLTAPREISFKAASNKTEMFGNLLQKIFGNSNKINANNHDNINKVINSFSELNILSYSAISKMLSETHSAYVNVVEHDYLEVDLAPVIIDICSAICDITSENDLSLYFSNELYYKMINKHFSSVVKYMKRVNYKTSNDYLRSNKLLMDRLSITGEGINLMSEAKFYRTIFKFNKYQGSELSSSFGRNLRDDMTYVIDAMATCTCIAKLLFFENAAKSLSENSEFYKIISNLVKEFNDSNLVIKKSRPLYDEFYTKYLFGINEEIYYNITIAILANNIRHPKITNEEKELLGLVDKKIDNISEFNAMMEEWIKELTNSVENRNLDIRTLLVQKSVLSIDCSDYYLLFNVLAHISSYVDLYNQCVVSNNKLDDKERYLRGDFKKEQNEVNAKYVLNNIASGAQFELFLTNLFKDLGYKVKHTGKAGDQGADLIIMKNNFVYAVQAKFYTGKLSNTPVQEIVGALKYYNANQGVVITNSSFTTGAESLAKSNDVILIDGKELRKLMELSFDEKNQSRDVLSDFNK